MVGPSEIKSQVNRTRENNDSAGFSRKRMLDENKDAGLRGKDKRQGNLRQPSDTEATRANEKPVGEKG